MFSNSFKNYVIKCDYHADITVVLFYMVNEKWFSDTPKSIVNLIFINVSNWNKIVNGKATNVNIRTHIMHASAHIQY